MREKCDNPSNFRCEQSLEKYLADNNIVGVYGVDVREITKTIRQAGVMNAIITSNPDKADMQAVRDYKITDAVKAVSTQKAELYPSDNHRHNVVLMDFGAKKNIIRELNRRGCNVAVMPYDTKADDILKLGVDGIMLSNGPGDPADNPLIVEEIKKLIGKVPIFGICLGHQLLALAMGGETTKLKYGHRGVNQPVKSIEQGRTYISSQNHGYAVLNESIEECGGVVSYINANDLTCEGVDYPGKKAFSVQFHPESCSGPKDTEFIFNKFISMMEGND